MTNIKNNLSEAFAHRLRQALINKGYCSARTPSGVDMHRFAQLTGHSQQICRKYLRGQAIPNPNKLAEIAEQLEVSPGWLLFGDCHSKSGMETQKITINKNLLHYIFSHVAALSHSATTRTEKLSDFFLELTQDVSRINVDPDQSKKIVDLALFSIKQFTNDEERIAPNKHQVDRHPGLKS